MGSRFRSFFPLAFSALAVLAAAPVLPGDSLEERVEDLGRPIQSVVIADAAYGPGPGSEAWMYVVVKGEPAVLNVIDVATGSRVSSFPIPGALISWGMTVTPDGVLYFGSNRGGRFYRYVPGSDKVEDLGRILPGESHHWQLDHDERGRVYGGTYPGGKLFRYDPATGEVRDYGRLAEDGDYVRGVAVGDGVVYAGIGSQQARIFEVDIESGESREIDLPDEVRSATFGYLLRYTGGKLFANLTDTGSYAYDPAADTWIAEIPLPSQTGPDGRAYFLRDRELHTFDPESGEIAGTGFRTTVTGPRSWGWLEIDDPDLPGKSLVTTNQRGRYLIYNPATGTGRQLTADVEGQSQDIRAMHRGPDGRIYIGGYLSPGMMAAYDPVGDELAQLAGVSQVEGFGSHGGELYIGVYSRALLFRYDPARPWNFGRNPQRFAQLSSQEQDRPFAFASAGDRVAIGTVPITGRLGGALTLHKPETGETAIFRNVVPEQSVVSLVYHEPTGLLIGGTSISGGLGIEPVAKEGELFLWDLEKDEKVGSIVPVPGEMAVTGLTVGPDGVIWGAAGQHLFQFDPARRTVIRTKDLYPDNPTTRPGTVWMNGHLNFHEDGWLYGQIRWRVFRLNPNDWTSEVLLPRSNYFAQAANGDIYFARGHDLRRLRFEEIGARP